MVVPLDLSCLHSPAGVITSLRYEELTARGADVAVLPAVGTHTAFTTVGPSCSSRGGFFSTAFTGATRETP